jgi:hypothetical protein
MTQPRAFLTAAAMRSTSGQFRGLSNPGIPSPWFVRWNSLSSSESCGEIAGPISAPWQILHVACPRNRSNCFRSSSWNLLSTSAVILRSRCFWSLSNSSSNWSSAIASFPLERVSYRRGGVYQNDLTQSVGRSPRSRAPGRALPADRHADRRARIAEGTGPSNPDSARRTARADRIAGPGTARRRTAARSEPRPASHLSAARASHPRVSEICR